MLLFRHICTKPSDAAKSTFGEWVFMMPLRAKIGDALADFTQPKLILTPNIKNAAIKKPYSRLFFGSYLRFALGSARETLLSSNEWFKH